MELPTHAAEMLGDRVRHLNSAQPVLGDAPLHVGESSGAPSVNICGGALLLQHYQTKNTSSEHHQEFLI